MVEKKMTTSDANYLVNSVLTKPGVARKFPYSELDMFFSINIATKGSNISMAGVKKAALKSKKGADVCLDMCIVLDVTGSMLRWINRVKVTILEIIDMLVK